MLIACLSFGFGLLAWTVRSRASLKMNLLFAGLGFFNPILWMFAVSGTCGMIFRASEKELSK
jgi:hypothetical protein